MTVMTVNELFHLAFRGGALQRANKSSPDFVRGVSALAHCSR